MNAEAMTTHTPDNTLHIYTRVSTSAQEDHGTSLTTQKLIGEQKAVELGFHIELWNEGGKSSNHEDIQERPILAALMDGVERGKVKHIFVQDDSRLSRVDQVASYIRARLRKHGVKLYTKDGMYDLDNPTDNLTKSIMDAVAQYDNVLRTNRFRQGKLHRVKQGSWHGGPPPFGYRLQDKKLYADTNEAPVVREIFEKYAAGASIRSIRLHLIAAGVPPRRGGLWSDGSIAALLKNTHYIGRYRFTDSKINETVDVACPALVPSALWQQVAVRLKSVAERNGQRNRTTHFYLLRDLMYCGHCGRPLAARTKSEKRERFYYCPNKERRWRTDATQSSKHSKQDNCGFGRSMNIDRADDLIWSTVLELHGKSSILKQEVKDRLIGDIISPVGGYALARQRSEATIRKLEREVQDAIHAIDGLEVDRRLRRIDEDAYSRQKPRLEEYRLRIEGKLDLEKNGLLNQEAERNWIDWVKAFGNEIEAHRLYSNDEKKQYLQGMVQRIDVRYLSETKEHEITINFVLPIVDDHLDRSCTPFVPVPGKNDKTLRLKESRKGKHYAPVGKNSATVE